MIGSVPRRQLIDFTRCYAGEVAAGRYGDIRFDESQRWHQRVYRDQYLDIWVISWLPSQGTELHDHGGSSGAFTVVRGALTEAVFSRAGVRENLRRANSSVAFGPRYIHDVRNHGPAPAVSVHAYSPPLTSMSYYEVRSSRIVRTGTLRTDDPEPAMPLALPSAS